MGAVLRAALAVSLLMILAAEGAAQFDEPWPPFVESLPVDKGFESGGIAEVRLKVMPEEGIHVYRDKIRVDFDVQDGVAFKELVLPEGKEIPDILEEGKTIEVLEGEFQIRLLFGVTATPGGSVEIQGNLNLQGCTDEICYAPHDEPFSFAGTAVAGEGGGRVQGTAGGGAERGPPGGDGVGRAPSSSPAGTDTAAKEGIEGQGFGDILWMILLAFGYGVGLSLTPCVLPIIPITSGVILRYAKGGMGSALFSSCLYVLGLSITYAVAGVAVAFVGGAVRSFLSSPYVLGVIAVVFVLLSLSMFGVFELAMPSSVTSKIQQRTAKGGKNPLGLLFMGALSGLVIGPCVSGPIVGLLIKIAEIGSVLVGFVAMFVFAWGMGLLIIAAGISTGLVPKAGVWMEWFKKFFGFVLLWGALYFLGPVIGDAVYQIGTALLLVTASVFLGGLDSLPADAGFGLRLKKLFGVLCLLAALFLGLHTFNATMNTAEPAFTGPAVTDEAFVPGGAEQLETALAEGRPTVLYFTADWCALCKTLKKKVLSRPEVVQALRGFAALMIDFDESRDLRERFKVLGPPTLVFFDREGKEREDLRFSGADKTPEEFIRMLESL